MLPATVLRVAAQATGFQWTNLLIVLLVAVIAIPLYRRLRRSISRSRRERWAREEHGYAARQDSADGDSLPGRDQSDDER